MFSNDLKMAWSSLRASKLRTTITVLGVIVGVVSIDLIFSLGNGVKRQIGSHLNQAGADLITVRPGKPFQLGRNGEVSKIDPAYSYGFGAGGLTSADLKTVQSTSNIGQVSPVNFVSGSAKTDKSQY